MLRPDIRDQFALDPDVAFLNHGSFGATPRPVTEARRWWMAEAEREPVDALMAAWDTMSDAVAAPARLLGCRPEDTVFVDNATTGVNAVIRSFDLRPGDAVITTTHAYDAVRKALEWVCARSGAELVKVELPFPCVGPDELIDRVERALATVDRPVLGVVDHVTSKTGLILPVAEIVARFSARSIPVLVDGAHVPGHFPVDVPSIGAGWYTGNLHKWCFAARSCGVLWVHPDHQATTRPLVISHGRGEGLHREFHWPGTRDFSAWLSAPDAVDFLEELGPERVWEHNRALAADAAAMLVEAWGGARPAPASMCGAMVTLVPPGERPGTPESAVALHDRLRAQGIEVPCFEFDGRVWLRISAQVYNELGDYERLAAALSG